MGAVLFKTQEEVALEKLTSWRESTKVSTFQAQAALTQAGFMDDVEAYLAAPDSDPLTKLAWNKAQEFRRMSPTVLELAEVLALSDTQLDDLFKYALTIEA